MTYKVTVEVPDVGVLQWLISFLILIETRMGVTLSHVIKEIKDPTEVADLMRDRSQVRYVALGDLSVLKDLGERTIIGLIYQRLVNEGPQTAKQIKLDMLFNGKSIESSLTTLRTMGLVESRPIETE